MWEPDRPLTVPFRGTTLTLHPLATFGVAVGIHQGTLYEAPLPVREAGTPPPVLEPRPIDGPIDHRFLDAVNRALGTAVRPEDLPSAPPVPEGGGSGPAGESTGSA